MALTEAELVKRLEAVVGVLDSLPPDYGVTAAFKVMEQLCENSGIAVSSVEYALHARGITVCLAVGSRD